MSIDPNVYSRFVGYLVKSPEDILATLTPEKVDIWHLATGVATEAGEALDAAKKFCIYNKPLDRENVIEELGDLEFYMEGLRRCVGVTRDEVIQKNIAKLEVRYPGGYTDAAAAARADKAA